MTRKRYPLLLPSLGAMTLLVMGCPPSGEDPEDMSPAVDMNTTQPDQGSDMRDPVEPDMGRDDMAQTPDMADMPGDRDMAMGALDIKCKDAWPVQATVPRGEELLTVKMRAFCDLGDGLDASQIQVTGGDILLSDDSMVTMSSSSFSVLNGRPVLEFDVELTEEHLSLPRVPITGASLDIEGLEQPLAIGARGPRTHLNQDDLEALHVDKTLAATSDPVVSGVLDTPTVFARTATNFAVLLGGESSGGKCGEDGEDDVGVIVFDGSDAIFHKAPLCGGTPGKGVSKLKRPGFDHAHLDRTRSATSTRVFATLLCADKTTCSTPLDFAVASFDANNAPGPFIDTDGGFKPTTYVFDPDRGIIRNAIVTDGDRGEVMLTVYVARDVAKGGHVFVVQRVGVDRSAAGKVAVSNVGAHSMFGGLQAADVRDGVANMGMIRSFKASSLDPDVAIDVAHQRAWVAYPATSGKGTAFAFVDFMASAGERYDEVVIEDILPATATMRMAYWGKDGRAVIYSGVDERGGVKMYASLIDPNTGKPGTPRSFNLPSVYNAGFSTTHELDVKANSHAGGAIQALFGAVIGLNNTKKDPEAPLDALLVDTEANSLAQDNPVFVASAEPMTSVIDSKMSGPPAPATGGVVRAAPVSLEHCKMAGDCDVLVASTPDGFSITREFDREKGEIFYSFENGPSRSGRLFNNAPGYAFLITRRAMVFPSDNDDGTKTYDVFLPHGGRVESSGDPVGGLVHVSVTGESVSAPVNLEIKGQGAEALDLSSARVLHYDRESGDGVIDLGDGTIVSANIVDDEAAGITVKAIIDVTYDTAFDTSRVRPPCGTLAACALAAQNEDRSEIHGEIAGGDGSDITETDALPWGSEAEADPTVLLIEERAGTTCGLATVMYTRFGESSSEPTVLFESEREDCSDLPVPIASADFLGMGSEQFLLARNEDGKTTAHLVYLRRDQGARDAPKIVRLELGAIPASIDWTRRDGASHIQVADVNEDGFPDLAVVPDGEVEVRFLYNDGRGGFIEEQAERIPGLSIFGVGGGAAHPGGQQAATSRFGSGTKKATTTTSVKPELL